jgi:hypothetical protein
MKARYTHAEFRATMVLKQVTIIDLARKLQVSRRIVDYFIKGEKEMSKSEQFIEILRPELDSIQRINRRMLRKVEGK